MTTIDSRSVSGVRHLLLNSDGPNVLNAEVIAALRNHLRQAGQAGEPVLLASASRFFCNGLDLVWAIDRSRSEMHALFQDLCALVLDLLELPVPVACAMTGHAIGAGKSLVLASDIRIGATGKCLLGAPEVKLGVPNPVFADRLLRALVSDRVANDLLFSGRLVSAEEAVQIGLLDEVTTVDQVQAKALERLGHIGTIPGGAWAASKRQRSLDLCASIRAQFQAHTDHVLLEHWFGAEAQVLLRAAAARAAGGSKQKST